MLIVKVENNNVEKALKIYKSKIIQSRQLSKLTERKEFKKKSDTRRYQIKKAKYVQNLRNKEN